MLAQQSPKSNDGTTKLAKQANKKKHEIINLRIHYKNITNITTDNSIAKKVLPEIFTDPTTTIAPATTERPPAPEHLDYSRRQYIPMTTHPPPTAIKLKTAHRNTDLNHTFNDLSDDLADDFESAITKEKHTMDLIEEFCCTVYLSLVQC